MARTEDHTDAVKEKLEHEHQAPMKAMSFCAVGLVSDKMKSGCIDEHRNRYARANPTPQHTHGHTQHRRPDAGRELRGVFVHIGCAAPLARGYA